MVVKAAGVGRVQVLIYERYALRPNGAREMLDRGEDRQTEALGAALLRLSGPYAEPD